ncbi:unnamed protein product [Mytilus coruscus]|uniref:Novel STAND NTPase 3 domain-containing protein n=1 Tax=Mytilus coruscus TaxID=42192 RepID=A0A6J8CK13_MYTCO|nr:unnamed protein product [Mytilus coruscus]
MNFKVDCFVDAQIIKVDCEQLKDDHLKFLGKEGGTKNGRMSSRLKENFLRHAILVVDHSKDALISLVDLDLSNNGFSFEQFIKKNQHEIYHLHNSSGVVNVQMATIHQEHLGSQTVETLVQIRNVDYGHAKAGEMTDQEYNKSVTTIELSIMEIGRVCNKETHFQGVIHDAKHGTLQYTLFEKYKDSMIETLARQDEFSKNVTEIVVPRLDRIEGKIAFKAKKIPTVIAEKIPKIIGESVEQFQETLGQNPTNQVFICQTAFEIQSHVKERTYVETNAVRKCIKNAEKYDVFVIYGSEGTGKTRTGLEILRQFGSIDQSYDLIKISILEEVKQVITDKGKIVILLDDVFRTNYCSCESVKSNNILDLLHSRRFAGNLKLIFTIDSAIRRSVKELFNSHRLFQGRYQMDLTLLQFCMTDPEKEEVLSKFCEYKKIQIKLNKPERCKDRILDRKTFYEITMTDPYIGYPKACFLFTSDIQNFLQGARFFKHTSKSLIDKVNTLSYKTDDLVLYATLVYILLCDSCITVDSIQVQKVADIMQLCGSRQRFIPKCNIIYSLEKMDGKYLVYDAYDKSYQFKHQMVYEAVVLSYFDVDPDSVIYVLTFEFISEMVRLQTDNFKQNEEIVFDYTRKSIH